MFPAKRARSGAVALIAAGLLAGLIPAAASAAGPIAVDDAYPVLEDSGATQLDVRSNDSDPDDDTLMITQLTQPTDGSTSTDGQDVTYTPAGDFNGIETFTYTIDDGNGGTASATVTVTVGSVNDPPSGADATVVTAEDASYTFGGTDFGFTDPNDNPANALENVVIETLPAAGALKENGIAVSASDEIPVADIVAGKLAFAPAPNANGAGYATFTFQVRDDGGTANGGADLDSSPNTVTIDVTPVNDDPVAIDDDLTVARNAGATPVDVLANDTDADGDTPSITDKTDGAKGTVAITGGGAGLTYHPTNGATGSDSFTYTIDDGHSGVSTGTVDVTISETAPDAVDDSATVDEDATATSIAVLANDSDGNGDPLTITAKTNGTKGIVAITGGGTGLTYQPNANLDGADAFTYTISDGHGGTDTATVSMTITPVNDVPTAVDDAKTVGKNAGPTAIDVLANDSDPDAVDTLTITDKTDGTKGTVVITGGGTGLTYEPGLDALGLDTFTYTIDDGNGETATATVSVTIAEGAPPVAVSDIKTLPEDSTNPTILAVDVLFNDSDPDGDPLTIVAKTNGTKGVVTVTGASTGLTYKPNANANGPDTFTYTIGDGNGWTAVGTVSVTITPVNDAPIAHADVSLTVPESAGARALAVLANDTDVDGDVIKIKTVTQGHHGSVAITGGGTGLTYNPDQLYYGSDSFTYTIVDSHGASSIATPVLLTVVKDTVKPAVTAPVESFYGQTVGSSTMKARISWSGADTNGTGIATYKLQVSTNGGSYATITLASATSTSINRTLTDGRSYRFRVRATDKQGNVSAYVYGPTFKPARVQNTSSSVHYTGKWATSSNSSALGGSHRYATSTSARVSYTTTARDIAWVATKTSTSGSAQVWIDGVYATTVNLHASSTTYRRLVFARHFSTLGSHTIELRPAGNGRVYLDAFLKLY
jgi:hypothetical protein